MELLIKGADPFGILASTKEALMDAQFVSLREQGLAAILGPVQDRFKKGLTMHNMGLTSLGNMDSDLQLIFIEDVVNFCFWAEKDAPKWQVPKHGLSDGTLTTGGWYGLQACFERGLRNKVPILDADYIAGISDEDAAAFFVGADGVQIPLLRERIRNLREAGMVLKEQFDGRFANLVRMADYDAVKIIKLVVEHFPSFRDIAILDNKEIVFYKRPQVLQQDMAYVLRSSGHELKNLNQLTVFADYKLPQIFRMYGVFDYEHSLAERIDSYVLIPQGSREEIEIRAATIWAGELIRQQIPDMTAPDIDYSLWLLSQSIQGEAKPYHRTRTTFY